MGNVIEQNSLTNDAAGAIDENITILSAEIQGIAAAVKCGKIHHEGDTGKLGGCYRNILGDVNYIVDTFVNIMDSFYFGILIIDKDYRIKFANKSSLDGLDPDRQKIIDKRCYEVFCCNREVCKLDLCLQTMESQTIEEFDEINKNYLLTRILPYKDSLGTMSGCIEISTDITQIKTMERTAVKQLEFQKNEILKLVSNLKKLAGGNLNIDGSVSDSDEDTHEIAPNFIVLNSSLNETARYLKNIIWEIKGVLSEIADKNLSVKLESEYLGEFVLLKSSINKIIEYFNLLLRNIGTSADQVDIGAGQVASSSQRLLQKALEQANVIEKVCASIGEIENKTMKNAIDANKASDLALEVKTDAAAGNQKMISLLSAMEQIKESSHSISKISKLIDDIAFQTNILSINAAIEAARAGSFGKGFAVVAEEVRNLAARSSSAAKNTTELISRSIKSVEEGYQIANDTSHALDKIEQGVLKAVEIVRAIADASAMQEEAVTYIEGSINKISNVTQMNMAMAEETAAVSEKMSDQAQKLKGLIREFHLGEISGQ